MPSRTCDVRRETTVREVLSRVSGKWPFWVLHVLAAGTTPHRFSQVLRAVDGITQKVLTQTLRHLERDGFVRRTVYAEVPPRVEYQLTRLGRDFVTRIDPVVDWARAKAGEFEAARRRFDGE